MLARWFEICILKMTAKHNRQVGKPMHDLRSLVSVHVEFVVNITAPRSRL